MSTGVMHKLQLYVGLPLFALIVLVSSGAGVLLLFGAYYMYKGGELTTTSFVRDSPIKFDWPLPVYPTTVLFLNVVSPSNLLDTLSRRTESVTCPANLASQAV
jgi:hypothetical protein